MSLYTVSKAFRAYSGALPLIGTNGARTADDVIRFVLSGASAVELVSTLWIHGPRILTDIIEQLDTYLRDHGTDLAVLRGKSVALARDYADIVPTAPRPEPWAIFPKAPPAN